MAAPQARDFTSPVGRGRRSRRERSTRKARRVRGYSPSRVTCPLTPTLSPTGRGGADAVLATSLLIRGECPKVLEGTVHHFHPPPSGFVRAPETPFRPPLQH